MRRNILLALFIFISGILTQKFISTIAKRTTKLLEEKPDQCPYCGYYLDDEEEY